jgi:hypothetical protein
LVAPPPSLGRAEWEDGLDMLRPASARAPLLITPEAAARDPETEGEKEPLEPDPETDAEGLAACTELAPCPDELLGLFRAVPCDPVAA